MSEHSQSSLFNEGQVTLPEGYQDRSVNIFTQPGADVPAFNISRDTLNADENLSDYINRQLVLMEKHLKGWKQSERHTVVLGDNLLQGENVHASYLRDGKRICQQQAVFNTHDAHILVFTMTSATTLTDRDGDLFLSLLGSFRLHA